MKYDTSPLSIDTLDVEPPPSDGLRFVPADQNIHQTNGVDESDSGPISQVTVLSRNVGFDTFIENRHGVDAPASLSSIPEPTRYRSWVMAGLLAVLSAFAGGATVYFSNSVAPEARQQQSDPANTAVTDVQPTDTFVMKSPTERAAEEPLVPHSPEPSTIQGRPVRLTSRASAEENEANANATTPTTNTTETATPGGQDTLGEPVGGRQSKQPEREAKVGGYVVEKPATARKPLARCADGTYSFSASKTAACSGRGGVSEWMAGDKPAANTPAKQAAYVLGPRGGCYYLDSSNKKVYVEKKFCQ
jgi:hypothetical protein